MTADEAAVMKYEEELIEYYDDIISNKYSYGISFGSLYEIFLREGTAPYGSNRHFTFTGSGKTAMKSPMISMITLLKMIRARETVIIT